jgi:site-specific recombinase XerD
VKHAVIEFEVVGFASVVLGSHLSYFISPFVKRPLLAKAGISVGYSPHSFRATGLTRFLEEGGTLEGAQNIADHADSRTTKLYDRRQQIVLRESVDCR